MVHEAMLKPEQCPEYAYCAAAWDWVEVVISKAATAAKVIAKFRVFIDFPL